MVSAVLFSSFAHALLCNRYNSQSMYSVGRSQNTRQKCNGGIINPLLNFQHVNPHVLQQC